ncbi:unnamed protein product [Linum trigynum]|uniref:Uncharacterized protein n=1 Tax=Linum trigynum TaxID=586398 RepID=A0AAV2CBW2_9ROSI
MLADAFFVGWRAILSGVNLGRASSCYHSFFPHRGMIAWALALFFAFQFDMKLTNSPLHEVEAPLASGNEEGAPTTGGGSDSSSSDYSSSKPDVE